MKYLLIPALCAIATARLFAAETPISETVIADMPRCIERAKAGPYAAIWRHADFAPVRSLVEGQLNAWFAGHLQDPAGALADLRSVVIRGSPTQLIAPSEQGGLLALRLPTRAADVQQALTGAEFGSIGVLEPSRVGEWVVFGAVLQQPPTLVVPAAAKDSDSYGTMDWSGLLAKPETPQETVAVMRALGLSRMEQTMRLDQQGTQDEMFLPGFKPPLMAVDPQVLSVLPDGQLLVAAFGIDGTQVASLLASLAAEIPTIAQSLADLDRKATDENLPTLDAVLRGWKGTVWLSVAAGTPFPTVTVGIPRSAALDGVLTTLSASGQVDLVAAQQEAVVIPMPPNVPFLVQVRATVDQWVVSSEPRVMDALASGKPGGYAVPRLPMDGTTVGIYTQDTAGMLRAGLGYLPLAMPALAAGPNGEANRALAAMVAKAVNAALPHLHPTVGTMQQDADGVRVRGTNLTMGSIPLGNLAGALLPAISQVRQMARQSQSGKNMAQIFGAMIAWSTTEEKWPPPSFEELAKAQQLPAKLFQSPSDPIHPNPYLFVTPIADPSSGQPVLIEDPACYRNQGTMVCFGDTHTKWIKGPPAVRLWQEAKRLAALPKATMGGIELSDWSAVNDILGLGAPTKSAEGGPRPGIP